MPFKEVERVIYERNPLIEVICQMRFPRILSINEKAPADFQDKIRKIFPLFEEQTEQEQQFAFDAIPGETPSLPRFIQSESNKNYRFSTEDNLWHINLTSRFLALSTSNYRKWEDFKKILEKPMQALLEVYQPVFFERIGLRYVNAFNRDILGVSDLPWHKLIRPFALGMLSNPDVCEEVKGYSGTTELAVSTDMTAKINTTLGYVNGASDILANSLSFIVDSDLYYGKKAIEEVDDSLELLHKTSTKLIRAFITDRLHELMGPEKV